MQTTCWHEIGKVWKRKSQTRCARYCRRSWCFKSHSL